MRWRGRVAAALAAAAGAALLAVRLRPEPHAAGTVTREPRPLARLAAWRPAAPVTPAGRLAAYLWAAPMTVAGLVLGAASGARPRAQDGVLLFAGARGPAAAMLRSRGFAAATLGHVIVALGEPSPALLAHELAHVRQAERLGPAFAPVYLVLLALYGYRRHPLERAARRG